MFTEIIIVLFEKDKCTLEKSAKLFNVKVDGSVLQRVKK
jgi:hypothetical protein